MSWQKEVFQYFDWLKQQSELGDEWTVGVSGGADSLALVLLLNEWAKNNKIDFTALTVQHGLRSSADEEAQYVAALMQKNKIKHQILYWKGEKPVTGIEAAARHARYELLKNWCEQKGVKTLLIAHHKRDQAETFLMRLQRGSGVDGLAAMAPVSLWQGLYVVRPLLRINPEELREYLQEKNIKWVEDESNECEDFLRVRVRKLLPELEDYIGLTRERICNTALEMGRVRDYLEKQTQKFINNSVVFYYSTACRISPKTIANLHEEIGLRVLVSLLKQIGNKVYSPNMEEVERLWEAIQKDKFKGCTLGDCEIFKYQNKIWIIPEYKSKDVLSKQMWDDFIQKNPIYAPKDKENWPYKFRRLLVHNFG